MFRVYAANSISYRFITAILVAVFLINLTPVKPVHALACTAIVSGDWNSVGTWSCGVVPGIGDTVTIGTPFTVTLTGNESAMSVVINTGGTLALSTFTLMLSSASTGMTVNAGGILNAGSGVVADDGAGGAQFTLANNATLQTANTLGITTGVALSGSIQVRGLRTYTSGANYVYNGTANQSVGNGLTQNTPRNLTINNPGNIVSLAASTTISGSLILTAGTLDLAANAATVGDIQGAGNVTSNTAGAVTLTTGSNNANTTYSGVISNGSGTVALTKLGTGALTLSGASTYSGTTTLSAGTININNATAIGSGTFTISGGTINNTSGAAITLSNNNPMNWNGNFIFTGTNALNLGTGAVTLSANRTVTANASILTVGGVIGGAFRLTKAGNGTLTLNGANTHSGTTLTAGRINIGNVQALGNVASTINLNGGTIDNTTGAALTLPNYAYSIGGNVIFAGTNNMNLGTNTVTLTGNRTLTVTANTLTVDGVIGGAFRLTKAGNGTLTLNGANTHSGTTLTAGRINIGNAQALGNVASTINLNGGSIDNTTGAALTLPNYAYSIGGNVTFAGTNNMNMGTNTVTLTGNRTLTVTANTLTIDGVIGGAFRLTKAGNGNLTLNGANTHSGTTLTAGRINIGNAQAFGNAASIINLNGGTIDNTTGAALTLPNNPYSIGGNVTFAGTNNLNLGTGALTLTGNRTITVTANTLTIGGTVGGAFRLTKAGNGSLTLNGANTHSGTTLTAGRLNIGNAQALGNLASTFIINGGSIDNTSGAALTTLNYPQTWGASFTFAGTNNLNLGSGAVAMTGNRMVTVTANNLTVNGVISGAARRLTKAGAGALTLGGANIHTGGVTLTAGTLNINNSQALGTVAGTFIVNGGTIDNTSGAAITTLNYLQTWGGNFTFTGTNNLNLGTGAVTLSANRTVTITANTLTIGGTVSPNTVDLTKTGAGTLSFGSNAVNLRNLTISAGTLVSTSGTMNLAGNFTNNGTFTHNNGTVNFNGAAAQSISGATTFNNLTLNNANGLTINAAETINGVLTFSNGRINTGANILIIETSGSISGAASGRHINGFLQKNFPVGAGQNFSFPVGNAAVYAPIDIANLDVAASGGIIASTTAAEHPNIATSGIDAARDVNRYWTLSPAGAISLNSYDAIFNFVAGDVDGGANTNNFVVKRYSGSWSTPTTGVKTATSTQATGITALGSFADGELSNFPPTDISLSATAIDENQPSASTVGTLGTTDPDVGDTFTYSLVNGGAACPGTDNAAFSISGTSLQTAAVFDYEAQNSYVICVRSTDSVNNTFDKQFTISVNNVNEDPTDIALSNNTIDENQPANTVVGTLSATDPDAGATFTFSLSCAAAGADDASFNISSTDLRSSASFDFETQSVFNICIRVTDQGGLFYDENFVINANDLNEDPTDIALSNNTIDENQPVNTVVGTLSATDPDAGATFTFSLSCATAGADDASFNISGTDLRSSASFDFETQNVFNICIRVTDQGGLFYDENFAINVNDLNEDPTDIGLSANSIAENQPVNTVIGTLSATDPDAGATFTFSLSCATAGADDASFNISGTDLRSSASFDFETQNVFNICIRVTDQGGLFYDEDFIVIATNVNEDPTDIALSNNTINENQPANTVVGALSATDPDAGATFTFSLACATTGADDASFNISGTDLRSSASFDFETQSVFNICIRVTDQGGLFYDENFVINANDLNEDPTDIALSNNTINENNALNAVIGTLSATDPDVGATTTFSLGCTVPGADDASFNISGTDLRASVSFDFETQSVYNICIRVTDQGGLFYDENFVINVNDLDDAPPYIIAATPNDGDSLSTGPVQITIEFNEDVRNDGSAVAANSTVNYLLVEDGANNTFNTLSCDIGLAGDDMLIAVDTATYNNNGGIGPFIATLGINGGASLPAGVYRLYVCGTTSIEDLAGNELNGGLTDSPVTFTVLAARLPSTGFPQGYETTLPPQPIELAYTSYSDLWLEIPKLGVKLNIVGVPATADGWNVTWLDRDAGWLNGSAFPTWTGNSVITAHVWDAFNQPGPFALLKNLRYGDIVKVYAFGQVYTYEIRLNKRILPASLSNVFTHEEKSWITLVTCEEYKEKTQSYSYRRMVRAVLISVSDK
jgi:LPXTG-site transpeptidase (sortase) family protein